MTPAAPHNSIPITNKTRDGEYFTYSYGLVFTNRLFSLILSAVLVWVFERESLTLSTVRPLCRLTVAARRST